MAFDKAGATTYQMVLAFEIIFLISIITKFLTDYRPDGETEHVKSLTKISSRYLHGDFLSDLIPLIPFTYIFKHYLCQAKLFWLWFDQHDPLLAISCKCKAQFTFWNLCREYSQSATINCLGHQSNQHTKKRHATIYDPILGLMFTPIWKQFC